MPRGGCRPGAGAPHGNLNALKHGRDSTYVQTLIHTLATHPATREALIRLARRQRAQKRQAERTAALILSQLLDRALRSLGNNQSAEQAADTDRLLNAILLGDNQTAHTDGRIQSDDGADGAA
jgi:hypothetical protein